MKFVDLQRQYRRYQKAIDRRIHQVLEHSQYILGPEITELEETLARYVGVDHCVSCGSGTEALQVALLSLGIGAGDEVITVPFTWISSAEAILLVGAEPVFVDIEPKTFNIDINQIESAITPRTKAILPVSLFGQMPDYGAINAIAQRHGIPVIEDGAQSFGATQKGKKSCSVTEIGTTSFFPAKPFGCYGDGGALFTNSEEVARRMRAVRTHGGEERHHHPYLGMNSRLDTMQAAVLLAKFPHFEEELIRRVELAWRYDRALADCCVTPVTLEGNTHSFAQYTVRCEARDEVVRELSEKRIPTAVYYPKCLHEQPVFSHLGYTYGDLPEAERAAKEVFSLPLYPYLTDEEQGQIIEAMQQANSVLAVL